MNPVRYLAGYYYYVLKHYTNFTDISIRRYAEVGLRRLGLETDVTSAQLERAQLKLARWRDVVAFFTLRLCLLPVVETAILLDRMLFLAQNGMSSNTFLLFFIFI